MKEIKWLLDEKTLEALQTQYQFCADGLVPRASVEAPTPEQMSRIRGAHNDLLRTLFVLRKVVEVVRDGLWELRDPSSREYLGILPAAKIDAVLKEVLGDVSCCS